MKVHGTQIGEGICRQKSAFVLNLAEPKGRAFIEWPSALLLVIVCVSSKKGHGVEAIMSQALILPHLKG